MRIELGGVVQGVGFRPFVYREAVLLGLKGFVQNSMSGVVIEAEGPAGRLKKFLKIVLKNPPPLAGISAKTVRMLRPAGPGRFEIKKSITKGINRVLVSPDIATCGNCVRELFSQSDRRSGYPFINCTDCGPRFTIITDLPYDRRHTTMSKFRMCADCSSEYNDPATRRYHAQPNACGSCGPRVWLVKANKDCKLQNANCKVQNDGITDPIKKAARLIERGKIVAVKGVGGFLIMCDAGNNRIVRKLRRLKHRPFKPFAVMMRDAETAGKYCEIDKKSEKALAGPQRPVTLLKKRVGQIAGIVADSIAPRTNYLGVMLPYAPVLHLLLKELRIPAVVATSANIADEPLVADNAQAIKKLSGTADYFLLHDRDIKNRCDDSIVQVIAGKPAILRRARGFVPLPVETGVSPGNRRQVLGCGAELKNTFCLAEGRLAFVSQHIGDLKNRETFDFYRDEIRKYREMFGINPDTLAYDLHPDYLATGYALESGKKGAKLLGVQHHFAHALSCMADNKLEGRVIGVILDGTGYGIDGNIWGGEFLIAGYKGFERAGRLKYIPMPGGDKVAEEPWRMALSFLADAYGSGLTGLRVPLVRRVGKNKIKFISRMLEQKINCPLTSSMGRFFDAVSSLLGICDISTYEAQAAVELQAEAEKTCQRVNVSTCQRYKYKIENQDGVRVIETGQVIRGIVKDLAAKVPPEKIAYKFHATVADMVVETCGRISRSTGLKRVVLSGGVFQNKLLLEMISGKLVKRSFAVFTHSQVPCNDGGISLGQAAFGLAYKNPN
ncbi:carbamoyltransferase HypF [Candidatus Desantisbacteria bacterium CG1_02_49_89]|nr:MAG: carbamoyltransferase HypF [Candidatus Desantisbacteria bacterium CG1_02_49_89]